MGGTRERRDDGAWQPLRRARACAWRHGRRTAAADPPLTPPPHTPPPHHPCRPSRRRPSQNRADLVADGHLKEITKFEAARKAADDDDTEEAAAPSPAKAKAKAKVAPKAAPRSRAAARSKTPPRKSRRAAAQEPSPAPAPAPAPRRRRAASKSPATTKPKATPKAASPAAAPKAAAPTAAPKAAASAAAVPAGRCPVSWINALLLSSVALVAFAAGHAAPVGAALDGAGVPRGLALFLATLCALGAALLHGCHGTYYGKWVCLGLVWRACAEYVLATVWVTEAAGSAAQNEAFVAVVVGALVSHGAFAMANAPALNDTRLALLACVAMVGADYVLAFEGGAMAADGGATPTLKLVRVYGAGLSAAFYALAAVTSA